MKAIGYVRVSTEEQGQEDRFSLPHQKEHIRSECKARGWELLGIYEDTESGKSTKKRAGFKSAMDSMGHADILIVHELDRLSRNLKDTLVIIDELHSNGRKFVSIHDNIDSSRPDGELQLHILAVFAHYFRSQLGRKVHGGMLTRAAQGLCNTKPPFGYSMVDKKLVINPDEAWIVKKVFDMYLSGKGIRAIVKELNELGLRTRRGFLWSDFPTKYILTNQAYIGNALWNKSKNTDTRSTPRPEEEWIIAKKAHEPIIDNESFFRAQEILKTKKRLGGRSYNTIYLLSGLIRCGHCGFAMVGNKMSQNGGQVYYKYICSGYHKKGVCSHIHAERDVIEKYVLDYIKKLIGSRTHAKQLQKKVRIDVSSMDKEHNKLKHELSMVKQRFERQMEAFENGIIELADLKEAKKRVKEQESYLRKQLSELQGKIKNLDRMEATKRNLSDFYDIFGTSDFQKQKAWLQKNIRVITFRSIKDFNIEFND